MRQQEWPCPYACQDPNMWDLDLRCGDHWEQACLCSGFSQKPGPASGSHPLGRAEQWGLSQCLRRGWDPGHRVLPPTLELRGQSGFPSMDLVWLLLVLLWAPRHEGWGLGSWTPRHLSRSDTEGTQKSEKQAGASPFTLLLS